jgi:hypothetical protein
MRYQTLLLCAIVLTQVLASHDHGLHIDPKFIHGEALRVAWLSKAEIVDSIREYIRTLDHLHETYDRIVLNPPAHTNGETLDETWEEKYRQQYRLTTDYLLIASHIC